MNFSFSVARKIQLPYFCFLSGCTRLRVLSTDLSRLRIGGPLSVSLSVVSVVPVWSMAVVWRSKCVPRIFAFMLFVSLVRSADLVTMLNVAQLRVVGGLPIAIKACCSGIFLQLRLWMLRSALFCLCGMVGGSRHVAECCPTPRGRRSTYPG